MGQPQQTHDPIRVHLPLEVNSFALSDWTDIEGSLILLGVPYVGKKRAIPYKKNVRKVLFEIPEALICADGSTKGKPCPSRLPPITAVLS